MLISPIDIINTRKAFVQGKYETRNASATISDTVKIKAKYNLFIGYCEFLF